MTSDPIETVCDYCGTDCGGHCASQVDALQLEVERLSQIVVRQTHEHEKTKAQLANARVDRDQLGELAALRRENQRLKDTLLRELGPECSICRRRHGTEVEHACE
jgi:hypothetical protein